MRAEETGWVASELSRCGQSPDALAELLHVRICRVERLADETAIVCILPELRAICLPRGLSEEEDAFRCFLGLARWATGEDSLWELQEIAQLLTTTHLHGPKSGVHKTRAALLPDEGDAATG